jgi:hypothetical protein
MARTTSFPYIKAAARCFGVSYVSIWYALKGHTSNAGLTKRYFDFAAPRILASLPLLSLPAGTRISIPGGVETAAIMDALKDFARQYGQDSLILTAPLRVAPWPTELSVVIGAGAPRCLGRRRKAPSKKPSAKRTRK